VLLFFIIVFSHFYLRQGRQRLYDILRLFVTLLAGLHGKLLADFSGKVRLGPDFGGDPYRHLDPGHDFRIFRHWQNV